MSAGNIYCTSCNAAGAVGLFTRREKQQRTITSVQYDRMHHTWYTITSAPLLPLHMTCAQLAVILYYWTIHTTSGSKNKRKGMLVAHDIVARNVRFFSSRPPLYTA